MNRGSEARARAADFFRRLTKKVGIALTYLTAVSLIITSYFTITEFRAQRHFERISVVPRINLQGFFRGDSAGWTMFNEGLGPAEVEWSQLLVQGQPVASWWSVAQAMGDTTRYAFNNSLYAGRLMRPGEQVTLYATTSSSVRSALETGLPTLVIKTCYCSLLGDCFQTSSRSVKSTDVPDCSNPPKGLFTG